MEKLIEWFRDPWHILTIYLLMNFIVFAMYGIDKAKAKLKGRRISEKTLIISAILGVFGAIGGMSVFHHKTRKPLFVIVVPLIMLLEVGAVFLLWRKGIVSFEGFKR